MGCFCMKLFVFENLHKTDHVCMILFAFTLKSSYLKLTSIWYALEEIVNLINFEELSA